MAILDLEHNAVVIRIVYDGPARAGKTTSVRALGRSLLRVVDTPEEVAGRTLFFDWMEYTGGLFEGHQIRCQIVSVPGQPDLGARRRALLATADVVVFVADTSDRPSVARSVEHVREMQEIIRASDDLPVGVIVQANKRDLPGAVPRDEIRAALGDDFARTALTESVAESGVGIRETFVFAVRLALDRIRELMERGELPRGRPAVDSAEQLLAALDDVPVQMPSQLGAAEDLASVVLAAAEPPPRLPDSRVVPSGGIWPPVEGRIVLHEASSTGLIARRIPDGDWLAGMGTVWRAHSSAATVFDQFDGARQALVVWARAHAAHAELLSPSRCVVVAEAAPGIWRLWQIVKLTPPLRAWIVNAVEPDGADELFARLVEAAALLGDAHAQYAGTRLQPTLDTVGRGPRGAQFVALMPGPFSEPAPRSPDVVAQVRRELSQLIASELSAQRADLARAAGQAGAQRSPWTEVVATAVSAW